MLRLTIGAAARRGAIAAVARAAPRAARASVRQAAFTSSARTATRATERINLRTVAVSLAAAGALTVAASTQLEASAAAKIDYDEVRRAIAEMIDENPDYDDGSYGPLFVRLAWHASGTYSAKDGSGGSDGARMRFAPEAFWGANAGLSLARNQMQRLKIRFPEISYADLWTLAGAVAIEHMGGPRIAWRAGRTDEPNGAKSPPDGRLPDALQGASHIRDVFYRMGFNDREIVALCGAHCLGRCHTDRSGFTGPWTRAPTTFSNDYFKLLLTEKWTRKEWAGPEQYQDATGELMMLPADMALVSDPAFRKVVAEYAADEAKFRADFASAFAKLLELGCDSKVAPVPVASVVVIGGGAALALGTAYIGYSYMTGGAQTAAAAAPAASAK